MARYNGFYEMVLKHLIDSPFRGKLKWEIHSGQDVTFDLDMLTLDFNRKFDDAHREVIELETALVKSVAEKYRLKSGSVGMYIVYTPKGLNEREGLTEREERDRAYRALSDACEDYFSARLSGSFDQAATILKKDILRPRDILLEQKATKQAKLLLEQKH